MISNLRDLEFGAGLQADLCIIGGGMAGITTALALADSGLSIWMIESGGLRRNVKADALSIAGNAGPQTLDLLETRPRVLGGSSDTWGGFGCPIEADDFEPRSRIPLHKWPSPYAELNSYYVRARALLGYPHPYFDERLWPMFGEPVPPLDPAKLRTRFWQFCSPLRLPKINPLRFGPKFAGKPRRHPRIHVLLQTTAVKIATNADRTKVGHIELRSVDGRSARLQARAYLLAGGAIENARLLLTSDGLGNAHGMVGRCFMERPHLEATAMVEPCDPARFLDTWVIWRRRGAAMLYPGICISPEAQLKRDTLNASAGFYIERHPDCPNQALGGMVAAVAQLRKPPKLGKNLQRVLTQPGAIARNTWRYFIEAKSVLPRVGRILTYVRSEAEPHRESYIFLERERDEMGMPRVCLDWRLTARDRRTACTIIELIEEEFSRLKIARLTPADWMRQPSGWPADIRGGPHHSGTTRMAADPREGVVDSNGRVHGMADLFVTGTGVFPAGGWANPALTVVALAYRMADYLSRRVFEMPQGVQGVERPPGERH